MKMRSKTSNSAAQFADLSDPRVVDPFRKAAKEFTAKAVKSKAAAMKTLVAEGIYTKSGKLTKNYR
jgi:hypothetical protein